MGDRKLVSLFPDARAVSESTQRWNESQVKNYLANIGEGKVQTFFNLPQYDNPIGIEIEGEGFHGCDHDMYFWRIEEDGSLKKNGVEFISYPLVRTAIDYALDEVADLCKKLLFGHRTSVHIHCNVQHYTTYQLLTLVAYYGMLERCFYALCDTVRSGNTFCYPIIGTKPVLMWYNGHDGETEKTTKYCAFNVAPVRTQYSVEFRHMHGNGDPKTLRRWIQLCAKLVYYVGNLSPKTCIPDTIELVSSGKFEAIIPEIWGDTMSVFDGHRRDIFTDSVRNGELWAMTLLTGGG